MLDQTELDLQINEVIWGAQQGEASEVDLVVRF